MSFSEERKREGREAYIRIAGKDDAEIMG